MHKGKLTLVIVCMLCLTGCMTWRVGPTLERVQVADAATPENARTIELFITADATSGSLEQEISNMIKAELGNAGYYVKMGAAGASSGDIPHVEVRAIEKLPGWGLVSAFISGFTFTMIPGYGVHEIEFNVDAVRGDKHLKYSETAEAKIMVWAPFVFVGFSQQGEGTLVKEAFRDLTRDMVLRLRKGELIK